MSQSRPDKRSSERTFAVKTTTVQTPYFAFKLPDRYSSTVSTDLCTARSTKTSASPHSPTTFSRADQPVDGAASHGQSTPWSKASFSYTHGLIVEGRVVGRGEVKRCRAAGNALILRSYVGVPPPQQLRVIGVRRVQEEKYGRDVRGRETSSVSPLSAAGTVQNISSA